MMCRGVSRGSCGVALNGSPRQNGNTAKMVTAFCEGAESSNHTVKTVNVCKLNVNGCLACEYCHSKGNGKCIQKDDMQDIYSLLKDTNMLVLASPIYYHGISGQLKSSYFFSFLVPLIIIKLAIPSTITSTEPPVTVFIIRLNLLSSAPPKV